MATENALHFDLDPDKVVETDILSDDVRQNWRSYTREWSGRAPFYSISHGVPYFVLSNYAAHAEVFRGSQTERFDVSWGAGADTFRVFRDMPTILMMSPQDHRRVRGVMQPGFSGRGVGAQDDHIEATVDRLLDGIEEKRDGFDAIADLGRQAIVEVMLVGMLGCKPEEIDAYVTLSAELPEVAATLAETPAYTRAFEQVTAIADEMLEHSPESQPSEVVAALVAACQDATITREEFVGQIMTICAGGLSSTSAATGMMLFRMCEFPEQFDEVRRDPSLIPSAIEECLRYQPAGMVIQPRFSAEDTEIEGTTVFAGMPILPCPPLANYDPAEYENPWDFDVRRNPGHMSFGRGIHICIGTHVARKIMAVTMRKFLARFPGVRLIDPDFKPTYTGLYSEFLPVELPMRIV